MHSKEARMECRPEKNNTKLRERREKSGVGAIEK